MSLSDRTRNVRFLLATATMAAVLAVGGCQVRPLYSDNGATAGKLAAIEISQARDRVEQEVRNRLIFLTSGGAGEPAKPDYSLALQVTSEVKGVLFDQAADAASAGRIVVKADYNLTRIDTGKTVRSGNRSAVALVDMSDQEFSKLRTIRDGENRAAHELAEIIRADLAAALGR